MHWLNVGSLQVWTFHVVAIKGDHKFISQAFNLVRHAGCEEALVNISIPIHSNPTPHPNPIPHTSKSHSTVPKLQLQEALFPFSSHIPSFQLPLIQSKFTFIPALQVCHRCPATMGRKNFGLVYTDLRPDGWRGEELQGLPWAVRPALAGIDGFCADMVACDFMHTWHLGVCRDLVGAGLKVCLKQRGFFQGQNLKERFKTLNVELRAWVKERHLSLHLKRVKQSNLGWSNRVCPEFKSSASDAGVVLRFLSDKLQEAPTPSPYEGLVGCVWVAAKFQELVVNSPQFCRSAGVKRFLSLAGGSW